MAPEPGSPYVKRPYCWADFTYPPANGAREGDKATLVVIKAGVPKAAPWAIGYYQAADTTFPSDTTLDQLYTAERFDAYLALGKYSMDQAIHATSSDYNEVLLEKVI